MLMYVAMYLYRIRLTYSRYTASFTIMTELMYDVPVIPDGIDIYETYHPGAVVRILACNANPVSSDDRNRKPGEVE